MSPALQPHRQTRQTIVRLLSSMASAKEISQYLKRFRSWMPSASPWSRSAARCCATISTR